MDASVAAKWLLRDEAHMAEADALLERCANRALTLYAPEQIDVEIGAALRRAVLNGRLGPTEAERSMANWMGPLRSGLRLARNADLLPSALPHSLALGVTLFDALYIVLAEQIGIPLVVADQRLVRSSVAALPGVLSLTDLGDERQE